MKKCPYCGMSNASMNTVCLNCWERLDTVAEDGNLGPMFAHINYGNPLLNADARIMERVLNAKHDGTFKPSSVLLAGVFIFLLLIMVHVYDWALIVLAGSMVLAGFFQYYRGQNRRY